MKVVVAHRTTQQQAIQKLDQASDKLFAVEIKNIQITDQKKSWAGSVMTFSLTGRMGFIALPLAGKATVDDKDITLECELPALLKNLMGEDKIRGMVEQNVRTMLS